MVLTQKIITLLATLAFIAIVFYAPFQTAKKNTEYAFAGGTGEYQQVTGLLALAEQKISALQSTLTAAATNLTAFNTGSIWFKENVLDPLAWVVSKTLLSQFTQSIVNWINSGFQGSPTFVTDLKGFLLDAADAAVGEYINDILGLGFLCEPFELNIRIALSVQYAAARDYKPPECTLSDVIGNIDSFLDGNFSEGGWQGWLSVTQQPGHHTEYGQYLYTRIEMDAFVAEQQRLQESVVDFGSGFLSQTICFPVDGRTREDCVISNPGRVIETQLNEALGLGQDSLVVADEFNEILGALFSQLAQQAVTGINGLLGMSAGTGYTDYSYAGGDGATAYFDALDYETQGSGAGDDTLQQAIARVNAWVSYQQFVVDTVDDIDQQNRINLTNASLVPGCYNLSVPTSLLNKRIDAQSEITKALNNTLPALNTLVTRLANADANAAASLQDADSANDISSAKIQQLVFDEFNTLLTSGSIPTDMEIRGVEVRDRQAFQTIIHNFETSMDREVSRCTPSVGDSSGGSSGE